MSTRATSAAGPSSTTSVGSFAQHRAEEFAAAKVVHHRERSEGHGRCECREGWVLDAAQVPGLAGRMPSVRCVMELTRTRIVRSEVSVETTYYVSSLRAGVRRLMGIVREHWGVENGLHWTLDAQMREDDRNVYDENGAQNLAMLRGLALMLLKRDTSFRAGIARKQGRVARNATYREQVLTRLLQGIWVRSPDTHRLARERPPGAGRALRGA